MYDGNVSPYGMSSYSAGGSRTDPLEECSKREAMENLSKVLKSLNLREIEVFARRKGLEGRPKSFKEICREFGVSRQKVCEIYDGLARTLPCNPDIKRAARAIGLLE